MIGWNSAWLAMLAFIKHLQTKLRSARRSSTPGSVSLTPTIRCCADCTVCLIAAAQVELHKGGDGREHREGGVDVKRLDVLQCDECGRKMLAWGGAALAPHLEWAGTWAEVLNPSHDDHLLRLGHKD